MKCLDTVKHQSGSLPLAVIFCRTSHYQILLDVDVCSVVIETRLPVTSEPHVALGYVHTNTFLFFCVVVTFSQTAGVSLKMKVGHCSHPDVGHMINDETGTVTK